METIVALAKRRGFVFPGSEIYGGLANTWDFGPLGAELKRNIKNAWWDFFVHRRPDLVGLDGGIFLHPRVWEASGHVEEFTDPLVDCRNCQSRFRADTLIEERTGQQVEGLSTDELSRLLVERNIACPLCGQRDWTAVRRFNLMFQTVLGPVEESGARIFLRPETAQAIFVDYRSVMQSSRLRIPFGIGQIGKAFRNEITPGNFIFRLLEFEQMEIEYFIRGETWEQTFEDWLAEMGAFLSSLGLRPDRLRTREHSPTELSHYSKRTADIEYRFGFAGGEWGELEGIANRTDFDLTTHSQHSGKDLSFFDQAKDERYTPYVIEPAAGLTRSVMAFLVDAYREEEVPNAKGGTDTRTVLALDPRLAPVKAAVLPLSRNEKLSPLAREIAADLREDWNIDFDDAGAIGRRYRRQDEIGTPFCVTVDFDSLEDDAVTVRERDTMQQDRVPRAELHGYLAQRLRGA